MATAFPTLTGKSIAIKKAVIPGEVRVQTTLAGKEVRTAYQVSLRYRYTIPLVLLRTTERAAVITFLSTIQGKRGLVTFSDPDTGTSMTCRLDMDEVEYQRIVSGLWGDAEIRLITVL